MKPAPEKLHGPGSQMDGVIQDRQGEGETERAAGMETFITGNNNSPGLIFSPILFFHAKIGENVLNFSRVRS